MGGFRLGYPLGFTHRLGFQDGTLCRLWTPLPGPLGMCSQMPLSNAGPEANALAAKALAPAPANAKPASELAMSDSALTLLKGIETLRLKPYDDQTGKEITEWTQGATIGYGHLIKKGEWETYKDGITEADADKLFSSDLAPFVKTVQSSITVALKQNEFDALVILAFNIGAAGFAGSSVVKLVNDPEAKTSYSSLESAWKAWNKSQGKVMKGLDNRRQAEWKIYSEGIYERW